MKDIKTLSEIKKIMTNTIKIISCDSYKNNEPKISHTQYQIIKYLVEHHNEDVYQNSLEKIFKMSRASISGVLQTMEKNNIVVREVSKLDTRVKKIMLSKEGLNKVKKVEDKFSEIQENAIRGISSEELEAFSSTLNKINKNMIDSYKEVFNVKNTF